MNNRLHNITNPHQTPAKRIVCVCSAGLLRSPTAANVLHQTYGHNTRSCGVDEDHALVPVDEVLLHWADQIICMEDRHARVLEYKFPNKFIKAKIKVLGIPDSFAWNDPNLQTMILEKYKELEF